VLVDLEATERDGVVAFLRRLVVVVRVEEEAVAVAWAQGPIITDLAQRTDVEESEARRQGVARSYLKKSVPPLEPRQRAG